MPSIQAGLLSAISYGLLFILGNGMVLFYPSAYWATEDISVAAQAGLFFIANLLLALLAIFWPRLQPRHILLSLLLLLLGEMLPLLLPELLFWVSSQGALDPLALAALNRYYQQCFVALPIQALMSLIVASGLWMKAGHSDLQFYYLEPSRREVERLFAFREALAPAKGLTRYVYSLFLKKCLTPVAVENGRLAAALHLARIGDRLFVLEWIQSQEGLGGDLADRFLRYLFSSTEFQLLRQDLQQIIFVLNDTGDKGALLQKYGFRPLRKSGNKGQEQLIAQISEQLTERFRLDFSSWTPAKNGHFYLLPSKDC